MASTAKFDVWQNTAGVNRQTVLQVVQTVKTDTFSTTSNTWTDLTGMSVSITPYYVTSKLLISISLCFLGNTSTQGYARLVRNESPIAVGDSFGSRVRFTLNSFINQENEVSTSSITFLDSPSSISSTNYKIQVMTQAASPVGTIFVNRSSLWADNNTSGTGISTITVMEIAQ